VQPKVYSIYIKATAMWRKQYSVELACSKSSNIMIEKNSFTLLVTKIFILIISAVFWHGVCRLEFSWTGVIACAECVLSFLTICLTFTTISAIRPDIRWLFNAFSWAYLGYWAPTSLIAGLSSRFQALKAWNLIMAILQQIYRLTISNNIHLVFCCLDVCYAFSHYQFFSRQTRNPAVTVSHFEYEEEKNRFLAQFANMPDDGECPICMGPHRNPTKPLCGHVFCCYCIHTWCRVRSATCPVCRRPVTKVLYDRTPSAEDLLVPAEALFDFDRHADEDWDVLEREFYEIVESVMAYKLILCSTVVFCLALLKLMNEVDGLA
jgi:hypothetical protein